MIFLCRKGWKCSSYILTIFHAKKPQRSFLMAMWELNLQDTLWVVLRAGGRLKLIPTCSLWKRAGGQVIPILKWNPNKTHSAGREKGKWNKHRKSQPNIEGFSPSLVSSSYSQKTELRYAHDQGFPAPGVSQCYLSNQKVNKLHCGFLSPGQHWRKKPQDFISFLPCFSNSICLLTADKTKHRLLPSL